MRWLKRGMSGTRPCSGGGESSGVTFGGGGEEEKGHLVS